MMQFYFRGTKTFFGIQIQYNSVTFMTTKTRKFNFPKFRNIIFVITDR